MMAQQRVCVIGAGVIGLSCAVNIIETISNVDVTIVSHLFSPNTTSDVAAAIFGLKPLVFGDTSPSLQKNWFLTTSHHMESILKTQEASEAGVNVISGYYLHNEKNNDKKLPWRDIAHGSIRSMTNSELNLYPGYSNGLSFSMLMCETRKYLPWLMKRYKDHGGKVIKQHIGKLIELSEYNIIVNCAGVEAKHLVNDDLIHPARGQTIRVSAPWLKKFCIVEDHTSSCHVVIIPRSDDVFLGVTIQPNNWNKEVSEIDKQTIMDACCRVIPRLKEAPVLEDCVGLRPMRQTVRLEKDILRCGDKTIKVVHNYGHGAKGVCFSWGCAIQATKLVKELLSKVGP